MQEQENLTTTTTTTNIDNLLIGNFNYDDFLIDIEPLEVESQQEHQQRHNSIDTNTPVSSCNQESINNDDDICCSIKIINNNNNDDVISSSSSSTTSSSSNNNINMLYNLKLEPTTINYNDLFIQQQQQQHQQGMLIKNL
jgi:hypothetical protein